MMLFKALLTRLSGGRNVSWMNTGSSHRRSPKSIYRRYPSLSKLVIKLLEQSGDLMDSVSSTRDMSKQLRVAYPAMEIIDRVGVPPNARTIVQQLLLSQFDSSLWNLREKAARTLSTLVDEPTLLQEALKILTMPIISQNSLHGRLLCLWYICEEKNYSDQGGNCIDLSGSKHRSMLIY